MPSNPVLGRELKSALRAPLTLALAALYLGVLATLVWWMWPQEGVFSVTARASRSILLVCGVAQLLLVILYAPAFAATAITAEKERNTYDLLFATLLRPWDIVLGKLVSSIGVLLLFVALSLPVFAACFFLGAVAVREAAAIYLVTAASSVLFGLLGLAVSAVVRSSHLALVMTYVLILIGTAGPWVPFFLLEHKPWAAGFIHQARAFSPLGAMASVILPTFAPADAWRTYLLCCGAVSALLVLFILGRVHWAGQRSTRSHGRTVEDPRELTRRKLRFPFYLIDPMRRRACIPDWLNPMFAKELRSQAFGGGLWVFRIAAACFGLSILMMTGVVGNLVGPTPNLIRAVSLVFQLGLVVLIVPSLTAGAITQERERGSLELLRLSRLGPVSFLIGKLGVALLFVAFLVLGALPGWYAIHYLEINTTREILDAWTVIGTTILFALAAGLFASAVAARTAVATALAYAITFLAAIVTLLPLLAADQLSLRLREAILVLNPFASSLQVLTRGAFDDLGVLWQRHVELSLWASGVFLGFAFLRLRRLLLPQK
jgi:ABC-type transport system involved in multi-copper enzyme maturation permease subunit